MSASSRRHGSRSLSPFDCGLLVSAESLDDVLVFPQSASGVVGRQIGAIGGISELPFTAEDDPRMQAILEQAILAVECENSLWRAHSNHYGYPLGDSAEEPRLLPAVIQDKNGHILPYVTFQGGRLTLRHEATNELQQAESQHPSRP